MAVKKGIGLMDRCKELLDELNKEVSGIRPKEYEVIEKKTFMVPMEDGKKLYTRIFFPEGVKKGILTFQRSCYEFQVPVFEWMALKMAERGFISGYQLCRGIGASEGEWEPFANERNDGICTLNWLQEQDFADQIGLYGLSYGGYAWWLTADALPPKVKTMVIAQAGIDRYRSIYEGGCFRHDVYTAWAIENAGFDLAENYPRCCQYRPFLEMDEAFLGKKLPWFREWLLHPDEEDEYWKKGVWGPLKEVAEKITVPVCLLGGWYDHHLEGMFYAWNHLRDDVKAESSFLIGPWIHGLQNCIDAYPVNDHEHDSIFGFNEAFRHMDKFFNHDKKTVKGLQGYVIGADRWVKEENIRICDKREIRMKYHDISVDGRKRGSVFIHDPDRPIEAVGGESMLYAPPLLRGVRKQVSGAFAQKDDRILSFYSDVLGQELTAAGSIRVVLDVTSDVPDTAVVVKLMEEFEDGTAYNIRGGASTISYRNGAGKRMEDYVPGKVVFMKFDLWPVMWTFQKGSRIRLDISSSHFPEYHVHTNTKGLWAVQDKTRIAVNRVDPESVYLLLPVGEPANEDQPAISFRS